VLAGLVVGEAVVIWLTFSSFYSGNVNVGLIALVPNIVVVAVGALLSRRTATVRTEREPQRSVAMSR
jgi:SSS family solute:Na+ symporter